jgi:glycosyltransferase involved in cell wall biosynthesis
MQYYNNPRVSVVIPTRNEEGVISGILSDLTKQSRIPDEIIVVDGSSTDNTVKQIKKFKIVTVLVTKASPALQRSTGGNIAKGDYIFFLDADVRLSRHFIKQFLDTMQRINAQTACPFYTPDSNHLGILSVYWFFNSIFFLLQQISPSGAGSCIVTTKKIFRKVGGFKSTYTYDDMVYIRNASKVGKFSIIPITVQVSARRFRRVGILKLFLHYLLISPFFTVGAFKAANRIPYKFDIYTKK